MVLVSLVLLLLELLVVIDQHRLFARWHGKLFKALGHAVLGRFKGSLARDA